MALFESFFGTKKTANTSAIDVVTYVASLASNPKAIDSLLEAVREITARMQPGQPLSPADQARLGQVCLGIEKYLVEQEPLRTFDQATLQEKINQRFPTPSSSETTFWEKIKPLMERAA